MPWRTLLLGAFAAAQGQSPTGCWAPPPWNLVARNATELVTPPRKARHDFVTFPLTRHDASWRRSRATGWRRCTSSPSPPGCGKGSCSGCDGPTSTSPLARCTWSSSSRRDPHGGRSCWPASRWTRSSVTLPASARSGSCLAWVGRPRARLPEHRGQAPAPLQLPAAEFLSAAGAGRTPTDPLP